MENTMQWDKLADDEALGKTVAALKANGIDTIVVDSGEEAKEAALKLIPQHAEVMTMQSVTLDAIGVSREINESGNYDSVRNKLDELNESTERREMQKMGASPEWAIGSANAVMQDGRVFFASYTGNQLSAYAYGAAHVIWIVGTHKIVEDLSSAVKRIQGYVLPLESERSNKQYNTTAGSAVNKMLVVEKELVPHRITMIFVKEKLGF